MARRKVPSIPDAILDQRFEGADAKACPRSVAWPFATAI